MRVEASIDSPLIFCGDEINTSIGFSPDTPVHLLSAVTFIQSTLHLGDLVHPEPFESLRSRGLIAGHSSTSQSQGLWGMLGLTEKPRDYLLWSSNQQLLCADTIIDTKSGFEAQFTLPHNLCPTHKSKALAIQHQLVIEFQILKDGQPTPCLLSLPFRLYPKSADNYNLLDEISPPKTPPTTRQRILEHLDTLLDHRREASVQPENPLDPAKLPTKVKFNLSNGTQTIATIDLARPYIHTGDTLVSTIELSPECFHMSATIEMIESLKPSLAAANSEHRRIVSSQSYTVVGLDTATFQLCTPAALPAQVDLDQVKISYVLRIELVCTTEPIFDSNSKAKGQVATTMVSSAIPLAVVAPVKGGTVHSRVWQVDPGEPNSDARED